MDELLYLISFIEVQQGHRGVDWDTAPELFGYRVFCMVLEIGVGQVIQAPGADQYFAMK